MRNILKFWLLAGLILSTSTSVFAQANVALIKILKGKVKLDGRSYSSGCLAADGQTLELPAGSKVSIKLLRNSAQLEIAGPKTYRIDSAQLADEGRIVQRGDIRVAESLGSSSKTAGHLTRSTFLKPRLKKTQEEGLVVLELFESSQKQLQPELEYRLSISDAATGAPIGYLPLINLIDDVKFPRNQIEAGRVYDVRVDSVYPSSINKHYRTKLRVLTDDELRALKTADSLLTSQYRKTRDPIHKLNLAEVLLTYNQNEPAMVLLGDVLKESKDEELRKQLSSVLRELRLNTWMPLDLTFIPDDSK